MTEVRDYISHNTIKVLK